MSAKNFYQTFYQSESLFRLADEPWGALTPTDPARILTPAAGLPTDTPGLFVELDTLRNESVIVNVASPLAEESTTVVVPDLLIPEPLPVVLIIAPEPLPQPPSRPVIPSTVPPVQQQRLPQQPRLPQLNHQVLLLADEDLDPSNLLFLEKILKAVNLNIDGVDLLNLHGVQNVDFAELLRGKYINHFITFGVPFERLHLDIMMDRYAPVRFEGITFLMADSLPTIEADRNLKKRLWDALQRVFLQWKG